MRTFGRMWLAAAMIGLAVPVSAQSGGFDTAPWLADLEQIRAALKTRYANREWLEQDRGVPIDATIDRVAARARTLGSEAEMRALFDQLVRKIDDGHVELHWPVRPAPTSNAAPTPAAPTAPADAFCSRLGYDGGRATPGIAARLPGYHGLPDGNAVPAGTLDIAGTRLGVVRIGAFETGAFPALCVGAIARLGIEPTAACDDACSDAVLTQVYARLTADYERRLRQLRAAGAAVVLIDITANGGGSEWAEAAARSLSPRPLVSARLGFVRGAHWTRHWSDLAARLRQSAADAAPAERAQLLRWAAEADAARTQAETICDPTTGCSWLGTAGYATGLVGGTADNRFHDKPWGADVFSAGQHDYHRGSWAGPLIVLTDQETWSAAEEFAAMLQDNRAAVILGARTGGAGCGHTMGGTPVTLTNSGAVLELPDCVRFRADGSNEVSGVIPDVVIGWRANDGFALRTRLLATALPEAIRNARMLNRRK